MEFTIPTIICLLLAYLFLVRSIRWRRYHAIHEKYRVQFETDTLTPEEAQEIIHVSAFYDMPSLVKYSLAFALFKAAAIVSGCTTSHRFPTYLMNAAAALHIKAARCVKAFQDEDIHLEALC